MMSAVKSKSGESNTKSRWATTSWGQVTSVTDAASDTAQFTYNYGDLAQVTDPLGNVIKRVHRQRRSTDLRRRPAG
jgi:YD repeat-containing protein